jgi:hypothetical protein
MSHTRRSAIAGTFAGIGLAAQTRVGANAPIAPKDNLKVTRLETFLVKPRWLFLKGIPMPASWVWASRSWKAAH